MKNYVSVGLIIFFLLISSCGVTDPRTQAKTEITLEINQFRFHPQKWIIPSGETIQLVVNNPEGTLHTLVILNKQGIGEIDSRDPNNQFWAESFSSKFVELIFKAPSMPGEYRLVCAEAGHEEKGEQGLLVVVIPNP